MSFKITLRGARVSAGLSLEEVAARSGMTLKQLEKCELDAGDLSIRKAQELCNLYRVPVDNVHFGPEIDHFSKYQLQGVTMNG